MASLPFRTQKTTGEKAIHDQRIHRTCIKRHRIQRSPRINRSVLEFPNFFPTVIFTSFFKSQRPVFITSPCIERSLKAGSLKKRKIF